MKKSKNPQRIPQIKPFINKYNWVTIRFPLEKDDWTKFEKNNVAIAPNILFAKKEKKYSAYVPKITEILKTSCSFNDFKRRKSMALPCSKRSISIIKWNNIQIFR